MWHEMRRFRITGSRCYGLYTYSRGDWQKKSEGYFWPKQFTNRFVQHSIKYENCVRNCYQSIFNINVVQTGFIVSPKNPWLGYSPDGVIFSNGILVKLIEIKCPYKGVNLKL